MTSVSFFHWLTVFALLDWCNFVAVLSKHRRVHTEWVISPILSQIECRCTGQNYIFSSESWTNMRINIAFKDSLSRQKWCLVYAGIFHPLCKFLSHNRSIGCTHDFWVKNILFVFNLHCAWIILSLVLFNSNSLSNQRQMSVYNPAFH